MSEEIPRRLKFVFKLKDLPVGRWMDVGAGIGHYLKFMPHGSVGLDIKQDHEKNIYKWNFVDPLPAQFYKEINVVWCSNLIEHVLDPHRFLINLRKVFVPGGSGILLIACPNTIFFKKGPWRGTLAADHINFFNLRTLKLTMQYAGYKIAYSGSPSFPWLPIWFSRIIGPLGPTLLVGAQPIEDFQYPSKAHKILNSSGEIEFKDEFFSES